MRKELILIIFLTIFSIKYCAQSLTNQFLQLKAIEGIWIVKSENAMMTETWEYLNDSLFEGSVKMIDLNNNVLFTEKLAIRRSRESIYYVASVSNRNNANETLFTLKSSNKSVYIFENLKHDFPQRIIYDLSIKDKISAHIEGEENGKFKKTYFDFVRPN